MQFATIAGLIALALTTSAVDARCFKSGPKWANAQAARDMVQRECRQGGRFYMPFKAGESRNVCRNFGGQKYEFWVTNQNLKEDKDISDEECIWRLNNEIACPKGGENNANGFAYSSDPNEGRC